MIEIKAKHYDKWERHGEAVSVLEQLHLKHTSHNVGVHIIFHHEDKEMHYWPTTGKWWDKTNDVRQTHDTRFLGGLLTYINIPYRRTEDD